MNNVRSYHRFLTKQSFVFSFLLCFLNFKFIFLFASSILISAAINTNNCRNILLIVLYIFPGYSCYLPSYPLNIRGLIVKLVIIVPKYSLLITDSQPIYKVPLIVRDNFVIFLVNEKRIKSIYAERGISPTCCSTESTK